MTKALQLGQGSVTLDDLMAVVRQGQAVELSDEARVAMRVSADWVAELSARMDRGEPTQAIYSINTGFGSLSGRQAFSTSAQARDLSRRLVVSNSAGVGQLLEDEVVRAAMLIRAASLTRGYSAVRDVVGTFAPAVSGHILVRPQAAGVKQEPPLPVTVELARGAASDPALAQAICDRLRNVLVVQARVELVPWGSLPRTDYKSRLVEQ